VFLDSAFVSEVPVKRFERAAAPGSGTETGRQQAPWIRSGSVRAAQCRYSCRTEIEQALYEFCEKINVLSNHSTQFSK